MIALLTKLHNKAEEIKGRKLLITLALSFFVFLIVGLLVGYFISKFLSNNEAMYIDSSSVNAVKPEEKTYVGKIRAMDPQVYSNDKILYVLVDSSGNQVILLRAKDSKLSVMENLNVKVTGYVSKASDAKNDILDVERISVVNASN